MTTATRKRIAGVLALALLLLSAACRESSTSTASKEWDAYVAQFLDSYFAAHPDVAVIAGRHDFDGKLPDWSAAGIKKEIQRLHTERDRASTFKEASLDARQRFEREYLIARVDHDLFWLESLEWPFRNPKFYGDSLDPNVYVSREYAPLADRLRAYTNYARAIPGAAAQIQSNLRTPLPRVYVDIGHITFGGLASYYEKDVPIVFASVSDAETVANFRVANSAAIMAMKDLDAWLKTQEASAKDNFAIGPEKFSEMLKATERVDVPLAQLKEIAQSDLDRNLAALKEACNAFAAAESIEKCVAKAQADKPQGSPVEAARKQLIDLRSFIEAKNVVTIPGPEQAKVAESPPYQRWNFAYIDIPGPYERNLPSIYYISPPDPKWPKAEQEAYLPGKNVLLFTSVHEVWPGHFLQFLHANRSPSKFGQVFVGYAFSEGWAHYTEEMMWDAGLGNGDPAAHIGQLLEALLRNVRFLSAIGLHTGGMTVAESEKMFREKAYQDAGNSRQQAARGTFDPAYLNYTMGKLMIRRLREDWTASRGGKQAWKDFHDEFLKFGGPPIPLVRKAMLGGEQKSLF
ncbi:MAG TPA: DUF885 domain-containing protein [Pyrinomonadaceae bacterium]|nr:DUF885 domain-containing protein [Pyrinomonadaceae bacterium]